MKRISIINDEISDDVREVVKFLKKHKGKYVELRTINKKNILDFPLEELKKYANYLKENNIRVSCIASPILKWYPSNVEVVRYDNLKVDSFYFSGTNNESYSKSFEVANIFDAPYIRIFSFLKYRNFRLEHLDSEIKTLINLAKNHDKILLIENEPSCNLNTIKGLYSLIKRYNVPNLKILLDVGNLYKDGNRLKDNELLKIKDSIRYVHIKDYSFTGNRYTILGDGDINYKKHISFINTITTNLLLFYSLETHVSKDNKYSNSSVSFYKLKKILNNNQRIKYGIVGCGRVFKKHTLAIKEDKNSELVGVFDIDNKKMLMEAKNNDCLYYDSLSNLVDDVDVVNVCTPHHTHAKIINEVLRGGKKCLCEKPGCMNTKDSKIVMMNKVYKENAFVVYQNRFNKPILELEKVIKNNKLGDLLYVFGNVRWFREKSYYLNS